MRKMLTIVAVMLTIAPAASARSWHLGMWSPGIHNVQNAVYYAFCGHRYVRCELGDEAWRVAGCETGRTYSTWATNGQYVNIFQMGTHERSLFGQHHAGSSPWKAAEAAKRYYDYEVAHHAWGWTPWSCKP